MHIRLVAEWGPLDGRGFGYTDFDAVVFGSDPSDSARNLVRAPGFSLFGQTLAVSRFGSSIKLDDSRDTDPPGAGSYWISCSQSNGSFGEAVNHDNPVVLFSFDLTLADIVGVRHVDSVHRPIPNFQGNAVIWSVTGANLVTQATISGVDINYVPTPGALILCAAGVPCLVRRRRS